MFQSKASAGCRRARYHPPPADGPDCRGPPRRQRQHRRERGAALRPHVGPHRPCGNGFFFLLDGTFDGTFDGVAQGQHGSLGWGRHCSQMQPCCFGNNKRTGRTNDPGRHTPTPNGNTDVNVVPPSGRTWGLAGLHRLP